MQVAAARIHADSSAWKQQQLLKQHKYMQYSTKEQSSSTVRSRNPTQMI